MNCSELIFCSNTLPYATEHHWHEAGGGKGGGSVRQSHTQINTSLSLLNNPEGMRILMAFTQLKRVNVIFNQTTQHNKVIKIRPGVP